jgi:restriction endonuclease Mrr
MAVPDFQSMMLPVLTALADSKPHSIREISEATAEAMGVSEEDRQERLPVATKPSGRIGSLGLARTSTSLDSSHDRHEPRCRSPNAA